MASTTTRTTIFEVDKTEVVGALEMCIDIEGLEVDAAEFDRLTTGPQFEKLMETIQEKLEEAWHEMAIDLVSEHLDANVETPA